jgi:predicted transposase YbfD/YdcC
MEAQTPLEIPRAFATLADPRQENACHQFLDILTIALCAVVCGADGWVAVVAYARAKESWLRTFLALPAGIPSHDTFGRVFAKLNPDAFEACFRAWIKTLVDLSGGALCGKAVAIDGKSIRRSFLSAFDKSGMAHLVSAFVQDNQMTFAQIKTDGKGKELDAIEQLLQLLDLKRAVVTIDALACNVHIATLIRQAQADYLLQLKENQSTLLAKVTTLFDEAILEQFKDFHHASATTVDGDHGRIETRTIHVLWDVKHLGPPAKEWPGLKSVVRVESTRQTPASAARASTASVERHYYISSLDRRHKPETFLSHIRGHWGIENNLHWQLDVSFSEDDRRIRAGHGAENFSRLCRMALTLLKNETTQKTGIAIKRQTCGWDNAYLLKVLMG